jgi:hypothetical protein
MGPEITERIVPEDLEKEGEKPPYLTITERASVE